MWKKILCIGLVFSIAMGCSALTSYPGSTRDAREAFEKGNFSAALSGYADGLEDTRDGVCYRLESGLVAHTSGEFKKSQEFFNMADARIEEFRDRAAISASDVGEEAGAVLFNEKTIPYKGEFFERVLLHTYKAVNYLYMGNIEKAMASIKKAGMVQNEAKEEYEKELATSQKESAQDKDPKFTADFQSKMLQQYQIPNEYLNDKSNIYQLGCTFYLASLIYEMNREYNTAYIMLKKLHEINPQFPYGLQDLYYMAQPAGFSEDIPKWASLTGGALPPLSPEMGSVVVFYQCDRGPYKQEKSFVVPTGAGFQKVAWPVYIAAPKVAGYIDLTIGGTGLNTVPLTDINSIALRYHKDKSTVRAVRMAVRLAAKIAAQHAAKEATRREYGEGAGWLAGIATSILTSITEQADERCWMTLPRNIQFLRVYLPAGEHDAKLQVKGASGGTMQQIDLGRIKVSSGKITLITARSIGNKVFCHVQGQRKVSN